MAKKKFFMHVNEALTKNRPYVKISQELFVQSL